VERGSEAEGGDLGGGVAEAAVAAGLDEEAVAAHGLQLLRVVVHLRVCVCVCARARARVCVCIAGCSCCAW
jgi:hypothetical protein